MIGASVNQYQITAAIGAGGMGEVFRARDTRLSREVAVKVLPKHFVADTDRLRRFEQEAKTLAALNHPNVLTVFDAGVHEGAPYLVSELLEGKTLREEMNGGALPVRKATEYALQIAQGLAAAHGKGIIHRDLKPENIFVTKEGRVKILDFGLAKLKDPSPGLRPPSPDPMGRGQGEGPMVDVDAPTLKQLAIDPTEPGKVMGTPAYMSPEQARAEPADHRSDIFAFGCVLYEMLSGTRAFRRNTPVESMNAILNEEPPDVTTSKQNIPQGLVQVVERCLEKQPDNRFQTAKDLAFALSQLSSSQHAVGARPPEGSKWVRAAWAVMIVLMLGLCSWYFAFHLRPDSPTSSKSASVPSGQAQKSVAVLPFLNMSADKSDEYLSDGMTEELLNSLAKVKGLRVPGRSSSFAFKGKNEEGIFRKVGEQLRVSTVLEGSVRKAGNQLRITAQLINVADGFHLWSETYDRDMTNIFAIQSDIAARVAEALKVQLLGAVEPRRKPTESIEAYKLYMQGRQLWNRRTAETLTQAIEYFNKAIAADPAYEPFRLADSGTLASVSTDGTLVLSTQEADLFASRQMIWVERSGTLGGLLGLIQRGLGAVRLSPDERSVAFQAGENGRAMQIWIADAARGTALPLARSAAFESSPFWLPSGQALAASYTGQDGPHCQIKMLNAQRPSEQIGSGFLHHLSRSGQYAFLLGFTRTNVIGYLRLSGGTNKFVSLPNGLVDLAKARVAHPNLSPDDSIMAYYSEESGQGEVYAVAFPDFSNRIQVSRGGGKQPQWRRDGSELFYLSLDGRAMMSVPVTNRNEMHFGEPVKLFDLPNSIWLGDNARINPFDVSADGQRFLLVQRVNDETVPAVKATVLLIENWFEEFREKK